MSPCEGAEILARVGTDVVLACDILPEVNEELAKIETKLSPVELESRRLQLIKEKLMDRVQTKVVMEDIKREMSAEAVKHFMGRLETHYEQTEVDPLMKRYQAENREQLNVKLRAAGTSVEHERLAFCERIAAQQWMRQKVKLDDEVSLEAMLDYYRQHPNEFETPAQARWEELMVRQSQYATRGAAYAAIAEMGNEVMAGKPFAEVAKARSQGATAAKGGQNGWTSKGSLKSQDLNRALFGLPLNQLSQIIESPQGFQIIRVLERKEAVKSSFLDAQVKIRDKIKQLRTQEQMQAYFKKIEARIPTEILLKSYVEERLAALEKAQQQSRRP